MQATRLRVQRKPARTRPSQIARTLPGRLVPDSQHPRYRQLATTEPPLTTLTPTAPYRCAFCRTLPSSRAAQWTAGASRVNERLALGSSNRARYGPQGQNRSRRRGFCSTKTLGAVEKFGKKVEESLEKLDEQLLPDDVMSWARLFGLMEEKHGLDGVWACFELLRKRHQLHLILRDDAEGLMRAVVDAASEKDSRLETILNIAVRLRVFSREWPDFYVNVMKSLLDKRSYESAVKWHLRLSEFFSPGPDVLAGVLSAFIFDETPAMQQTLSSIYIFSRERKLYDRLIPVLFSSGIAWLARSWRSTLLKVGDTPTSLSCWPYINFLDRFDVKLAPEEVSILEAKRNPTNDDNDPYIKPESTYPGPPKSSYQDAFVAKWLASSWLSIEFCINLVRTFGISSIGPQSLQALALREPDARATAARIDQLERHGIHVYRGTYCKMLVFFARSGEDRLLDLLVHSDIHPDEFDDAEKRKAIMANAISAKHFKTKDLLQGVEWALAENVSPRHLNQLLHFALSKKTLRQARLILNRMDAMNVTISPRNAVILLRRAFAGISSHPRWFNRGIRSYFVTDPPLERAIAVARRLASHKVAIPVKYWEALLYNLGRQGRFEDFLQLSLEILDIYNPPEGLVPICLKDMPPSKAFPEEPKASKRTRSLEDPESSDLEEGLHEHGPYEDESHEAPEHEPEDGQDTEAEPQKPKVKPPDPTQYIPGCLPLSHHRHPIRALFNWRLQRSIIRWGFDRMLAGQSKLSSHSTFTPRKLADHDIACGVRILALLRDRGLSVDPRSVRSALYYRIIIGETPRRRHRSRDAQHVALPHVKNLVDNAWGGNRPLLPQLSLLSKEVDRRRPHIWKDYRQLFRKSYNDRRRYAVEIEEGEALTEGS